MPNQFAEGQKLKRLVKVYGVGTTEVTFSAEGLAFRIPKTRKYITLTWAKAVETSDTPTDVPSFLMGKPVDFLKHEVAKVEKKNAARPEKV